MSEQVWSDWFEHKPGDPCPIRWATRGQWIWRLSRLDYEGRVSSLNAADDVDWIGAIKGYRYLLSAAPAGFVPPGAEKPWVPPVPDGFGPWVETGGADQELPGGSIVHILCSFERIERTFFGRERDADSVYWRGVHAYCLKLEDQPTQEQVACRHCGRPPVETDDQFACQCVGQEQVEATQKPETPEADASEDAKAANRPMFDADDVGVSAGKWGRFNARLAAPTAAPGFMVRAVRSSDGLLTVRGSDHRLGLWE